MGILDINTIQNNVPSTYSDTYIKEALSNLGQRVGAKGDSIKINTFGIFDILTAPASVENNCKYISISSENNYINIYAHLENSVEKLISFTDEMFTTIFNELGEIIPFEITNTSLFKYKIYKDYNPSLSSSSYFFCAEEKQNNEICSLLAIEINNTGILDGIKLILDNNNIGKLYRLNSTVYKEFIYDSTSITYDSIYTSYFLTENSVEDILNNLPINSYTDVVFTSDSNADFTQYNAVLPGYIKRTFNDEVFYKNNSYIGLKQYIVYSIFKTLYIDSENSSLILNKNFVFKYFVNDNTNTIYYSYDFIVDNIQSENINNVVDLNNLSIDLIYNYSNIPTGILHKFENYKFSVSYIENDTFVDYVSVSKNYVLPYIAENNTNTNSSQLNPHKYWYINDSATDIMAAGKNAGNPNILMIGYTQESNNETSATRVNIDILHSYEDASLKLTASDIYLSCTTNPITYKFNYEFDRPPINNVSVYADGITAIDYLFENIQLPDINKLIELNTAYEAIVCNCLLWTFIDIKLGFGKPYIHGVKSTVDISLHDTIFEASNPQTSFITVFWHPVKSENGYTWELIKNPAFGTDSTNTVGLDLGSMMSMRDTMKYYLNSGFEPDSYLHSWIVFDPIIANIKNSLNTPPNSDSKETNNIIYPFLHVNDNSTNAINESTNSTNAGAVYKFSPKFIRKKGITFNENTNSITDVKVVGDKFFVINPDHTLVNSSMITTGSCTSLPVLANDTNTGVLPIYPIFDFKEVLTNNQSILNRISIINVGFDDNKNTKIFHSFIGQAENTAPDVLTIGTSHTNYSMQGNETLTENTNNFETYKKLSIKLPVETESLFIQQYDEHKYFAILHVDITDTTNGYIINSDNSSENAPKDIPETKYMSQGQTPTKKLDVKAYIDYIVNHNSNPDFNYVDVANNSYIDILDRTTTKNEFNNVYSTFIIYLTDNEQAGSDGYYYESDYKYTYVGGNELIKDNNYIVPGTNTVLSAYTINNEEQQLFVDSESAAEELSQTKPVIENLNTEISVDTTFDTSVISNTIPDVIVKETKILDEDNEENYNLSVNAAAINTIEDCVIVGLTTYNKPEKIQNSAAGASANSTNISYSKATEKNNIDIPEVIIPSIPTIDASPEIPAIPVISLDNYNANVNILSLENNDDLFNLLSYDDDDINTQATTFTRERNVSNGIEEISSANIKTLSNVTITIAKAPNTSIVETTTNNIDYTDTDINKTASNTATNTDKNEPSSNIFCIFDTNGNTSWCENDVVICSDTAGCALDSPDICVGDSICSCEEHNPCIFDINVCSDEIPNVNKPSINVNNTSIYINNYEGSITIRVKINDSIDNGSLTAQLEDNIAWIRFDISKGTNGIYRESKDTYYIYLTHDANSESEERECTLTIGYTEAASTTITIIQAANVPGGCESCDENVCYCDGNECNCEDDVCPEDGEPEPSM